MIGNAGRNVGSRALTTKSLPMNYPVRVLVTNVLVHIVVVVVVLVVVVVVV